jgi:hypothetical protein
MAGADNDDVERRRDYRRPVSLSSAAISGGTSGPNTSAAGTV